MPIRHNHAEQQFIYITEEDVQAGKLSYRYLSDDTIDAYHTRVFDEFQGKGIAGELYNALITFALEQNLRIKPSCSYIELCMRRSHPELIA
ncbi:GNAT family N-acetyltransferase [Bibersteinia trehalosi]|uniref:GNAT family N-acetyltransferase n=1 Tax=Bibersteinia trehalosi TaxID=47735 RepID=UPI003D2AA4C5